jgi:hypothetical protein
VAAWGDTHHLDIPYIQCNKLTYTSTTRDDKYLLIFKGKVRKRKQKIKNRESQPRLLVIWSQLGLNMFRKLPVVLHGGKKNKKR